VALQPHLLLSESRNLLTIAIYLRLVNYTDTELGGAKSKWTKLQDWRWIICHRTKYSPTGSTPARNPFDWFYFDPWDSALRIVRIAASHLRRPRINDRRLIMRKFLLAATILAPFAFAPAFGQTIAGDVNLAKTAAGSTAGVASEQGTMAGAKVGGNGAVVTGAVSGNYTQVQTAAGATAGPKGSFTNTTAQQINIGGTVAGGLADNSKHSNAATGIAGGQQTSQATGGSAATASNANLGGMIKVEQPKHPPMPSVR
jgi:hypothetical protein